MLGCRPGYWGWARQVESLELGRQAGRLALNLNSGASRFYSQKASQYINQTVWP